MKNRPESDLKREYPILEFDRSEQAILEPSRLVKPLDGMPQHAVACFFQDVITRLSQEHAAQVIYRIRSEMGTHSIYEMTLKGQRLAVFHPGVGAPLAAGTLEEVIALGARKFMVCGGAGVLDKQIGVGHVIVPSAAVRDEGTSYHYLPPGREVNADPQALAAIEQTLQAHKVEYIVAKTWTTDAFYRETPQKVQLRKAEGCKVVEMEAATFMAVAQFRGVQLGQILYGGDDVDDSSEQWDSRGWTTHSGREKLFWLAAEACFKL